MQLLSVFEQINQASFDGFLDPPALRWNSRLRSCAGRFIPGSRKHIAEAPPAIEVASYLLEEHDPIALVADTVGHEMIHYWLWVRRRPYGHTDEFWAKMEQMGVSRYNLLPRARRYRYLYRCRDCGKEVLARKQLGVMACAACCKIHTKGKFDLRFELRLERKLSAEEGLALAREQAPPSAQA